MADTQLKARISADTSALNSSVDASTRKINGLKASANQAAGGIGGLGGDAARVGSALSGMGGAAGQAGQAIAGLGQIMSSAMSGPAGMAVAAATAVSMVAREFANLRKAQEEQAKRQSQIIDEQIRQYGQLMQAARGAHDAERGTAMSNARSMLAAGYTEEGLGADAQVALLRQRQQLARNTPTALQAYDYAIRQGLGEDEANAQMMGALQAAKRIGYGLEITDLERGLKDAEAALKRDWTDANEKRWRDYSAALDKARKGLEELDATDWSEEWREEAKIRRDAAMKAARKAQDEYAADTAAGERPDYERAWMREKREIDKRFRALVAQSGLQDKGGANDKRIAEYKALETQRDAQLAQAQKRYYEAREAAWEQTLAAENGVRAAEEARLTLQDQAIALEKTIHQQRQQILQSELTQIKPAVEKERQARKQLAEAEHRLARIKEDQAAKESYEKQKRAFSRRIAGFGFSLAKNRADPRMRKLDARVADNLAREANGERVHWTRRERARLNDYRDAQKGLKRLDRREQKRQRASQQAEAERAAKQQREAWQAAKSAADEVQKKFAKVGETLEGAAKRIKAALDEEVAAIRAANKTQNERAKARQGRQAEAQKRQEDAAGRALKRAETKYKGGDPNAEHRKTETIRQRRAREARERMAPGVPGAAAGGTGGGAELGVLRGIERGVEKLGDRIYVVK